MRPDRDLHRICEGTLRHERMAPVAHRFSQRVWMALVDLRDIEAWRRVSRWLSVDRPNLLELRTTDHLRGDGSLMHRIRARLEQGGVGDSAGPVLLLTQPRSWGWAFNPVSFFLCLDERTHDIRHVIAEINNTPWNERHAYVLTTAQAGARVTFTSPKTFHVSPFNDMDVTYRWDFALTRDRLRIAIALERGRARPFFASLELACAPLTPAAVRRGAFAYPAQNALTLARIYFEALRLWRRGATFYTHPEKRGPHEHAHGHRIPSPACETQRSDGGIREASAHPPAGGLEARSARSDRGA